MVLALVENHDAHHVHDEHCGHAGHDHVHNHSPAAHEHEHAHDHAAGELGFTSWNATLENACDPDALQAVLDAIAHGAYGDIKRVKGLTRSGAGWLHFDVAGGRASMTAFAARPTETPRIVAIGKRIDTAALDAAFSNCMTKQAA